MLDLLSILIDFVCYTLHYLIVIVLALPFLIWAFLELRTERSWRWLLIPAAILAAIVAGVFFASEMSLAPQEAWSADRLAPAIAWVKGYRLYYPRDQGPMLVQLYGPVSAMIYLPTALASHPTQAILIGVFTNFVIYVFSAAWFLLRSRRGQQAAVWMVALAAFLLVSSRQFVLTETATRVTIDCPAIGFAVCAFALLAGGRTESPWRSGAGCGFFMALSIGTKLTLAPVAAAVLLYAWLIFDWRSAMKFACAFLAVLGAICALLVAWFGPAMLFQMITVPMNHPWKWPALNPAAALIRAMNGLLRFSRPVGWITLAAIVIRPELPRFGRGRFRQWARQNPWLLPLMGAVAVLPASAVAYVKVAGAYNNASAVSYMALLAAAGSLSSACGAASTSESPVPRKNRASRLALVSLIAASCWIRRDSLTQVSQKIAAWSNVSNTEHEVAFRYIKQHPGEVYFPDNPLASLLAEGRAYHFLAGMSDLDLAGMHITDKHFRAWLPAHMRAVAFPHGSNRDGIDQLPEYRKKLTDPALPDWTVLTSDAPIGQTP